MLQLILLNCLIHETNILGLFLIMAGKIVKMVFQNRRSLIGIRAVFKLSLMSICLLTVQTMPSHASLAVNTTHNDYKGSIKLDFTPKTEPNGTYSKLSSSVDQVEIAYKYLEKNKSRYNLGRIFKQLSLADVKYSLLYNHYHFQQVIDGIPVENSSIIVSINHDNKVVRVFNNTYPTENTTKLQKKIIAKNESLEKAWDFLQASGDLNSHPKSQLTFVSDEGKLKSAYKVNISVTKPRGDWQFYINAADGTVLDVKRIDLPRFKNANAGASTGKWSPFPKNNEHKRLDVALLRLQNKIAPTLRAKSSSKVDGQATIFHSNPVVDLKDNTLRDNSPDIEFSPAYTTLALQDISLISNQYELTGPWVKIRDWDTPYTAPSTTSDGVWSAKRGNNSFNDAMTYYHIDRSQRYIQSLGFKGKKGIQFNSIEVDTNGAGGADNSYYLPSSNRLSFGHGGVDDNEDSDVILHEYGHAINHSINRNFLGGDTGAIGEGFSDYWATSYRYTTPNGRTYQPGKVFSWDGVTWGGRRLDRTNFRYSPERTYLAHRRVNGQNGDELWSTPLTQAHLELLDMGIPRKEIDTVILEAQFGLGYGLKMSDLANATVHTAERLYPSKPHAEVFFKHFSKVNILQHFLKGTFSIANSEATASPGNTIELEVSLKNLSPHKVTRVNGTLSSSLAMNISQANSVYMDILPNWYQANQFFYRLEIPTGHKCGESIPLNFTAQYHYMESQKTRNFNFELPTSCKSSANLSPIPVLPKHIETTQDKIVTLDASQSIDPSSQTLSYLWQQTSGPSVELKDSTTAKAHFKAPKVSQTTQMKFDLKVTNSSGLSKSKRISVDVKERSNNQTIDVSNDISVGNDSGNNSINDIGNDSDNSSSGNDSDNSNSNGANNNNSTGGGGGGGSLGLATVMFIATMLFTRRKVRSSRHNYILYSKL